MLSLAISVGADLEAAIGREAVLKLRDYLLAVYPVESVPAPSPALSGHFLPPTQPLPANAIRPLHPKHGYRFLIERYTIPPTSREWWRIIDSETGKTARQVSKRSGGKPVTSVTTDPNVLSLAMDHFLSSDEAFKKLDEL